MLRYKVLMRASAAKELASLPVSAHARVLEKILALADNPRPPGCKKMSVTDAYRIRIGEYRVLYTIDDAVITVVVVSVAHRREVYR